MTFQEWCSLNDYTEIDTLSADNHIFHFIQTGDRQIEIDEDLQSMQIVISEVNYEEDKQLWKFRKQHNLLTT